MQVIDYFSEIQHPIRSSIFVENVDVEYGVKPRSIGIVHGILGMDNGSTLQFMELVNIKRDKVIHLKYRFYLMNDMPALVDVQGMFDQEGAGMSGLLQEIVSSKHAC